MHALQATPSSRRQFLQAAAALPAGCALGVPAFPLGGGKDRVRVGLVGCGGRGTGAALQAVMADRGVVITRLADLFPDQVAEAAGMLAARAGRGFDCPATRRHAGPDAWRAVVESDVDLVILATPPVDRPAQVVATVAAGKHVWCESPAAVDIAGVRAVMDAVAAAAGLGLSFASGLCARHDPATIAAMSRIRSGDSPAGRPRHVTVHADLGAPWVRPMQAGWNRAEQRLRNWISSPRHSGGHLVERHVHAIDRALWVLGDELPAVARPVTAGRRDAAAVVTAVRYVYADGRSIDAAIGRSPTGSWQRVETVRGTRGTADLGGIATAPATDPWQSAMTDLVAAVRGGRPLAAGGPVCRATLVAILGRMAAEAGVDVRAADVLAASRPLQSV